MGALTPLSGSLDSSEPPAGPLKLAIVEIAWFSRAPSDANNTKPVIDKRTFKMSKVR